MSKATIVILAFGEMRAQILYPGPASPDTLDDLRVQCQRAFDHIIAAADVEDTPDDTVETVTPPE